MTQIMEVWADSGETVERERSPEELAQYEADRAALEAAQAEAEAKAAQDAETSAAAINVAKSLGFTDAMIAVMYPNLGA